MDVLSDVVSVMRTGEPRSARVEWYAPWGQHFLPGRGVGFQLVLRGSCWLVPEHGEPYELGAGDLVFMPRGHGHALADHPSTPLREASCDAPDDGSRVELRYAAPPVGRPRPDGPEPGAVTLCGAYQLDPGRAHPLLDELPDLLYLPAGPGRPPEIRSAVELLAGELERPRLGADTVVPALLDLLLLFVLRTWFDQRPPPERAVGWAAALNDPATGAALHAMHRAPGHPWTVEQLAALTGLSRAAFAKRFSALVGRPPLGYLTWWRLTTAARLLRESDATLGAMSARVGYTSEYALANAFKREFGMAPGRYRRQQRARG
ncbi:AraC family transcriptional regulator [Kitasatospora sp. NPDC002040]|uniref:AraC family transcriptional regulator n=1 Tax=Kitasatospora sp. NPDC002040 TaxID=3154661 RepID=UPI00332B28B0